MSAGGRLSAGSDTSSSGVSNLALLSSSFASRRARPALGAAGIPGDAASPTGVGGALRWHQAVNGARGAHAHLPLLVVLSPCAMAKPTAQVLAIGKQLHATILIVTISFGPPNRTVGRRLYLTDEPGWQASTLCFLRSRCASSRARRVRSAALAATPHGRSSASSASSLADAKAAVLCVRDLPLPARGNCDSSVRVPCRGRGGEPRVAVHRRLRLPPVRARATAFYVLFLRARPPCLARARARVVATLGHVTSSAHAPQGAWPAWGEPLLSVSLPALSKGKHAPLLYISL
jgi:hypothetical protein